MDEPGIKKFSTPRMNQVSEYPDTRTVDFIKTTDIPANKGKFNNPMKTARKSEQQY